MSKWQSITKSSCLLFRLFFAAHEEMRKLIETMPHPTRVDSLSWKLKYFYESCTALEHIVVPEQKLIRVIDQMGNVSLSFFLSFLFCLCDLTHTCTEATDARTTPHHTTVYRLRTVLQRRINIINWNNKIGLGIFFLPAASASASASS